MARPFLLKKYKQIDLIHDSLVAEQMRLWTLYEQCPQEEPIGKALKYEQYKKAKQAASVVFNALESFPL